MRNITLLLLIIVSMSSCRASTDKIDHPNAVSDLLSVEIGKLDQWLLIRGEDKSKPVLLWLHGGPGSAQMPIHHAYTKELEKEYVMVHWDQRGAGKSNHAGFREESMTLNRFVNDVHEVTQYLKNRFDKKKIILLGHSWGTQIGILAVQKHPEDYFAFISVGQVVHPQRTDSLSYQWLKQEVEKRGSDTQKKKLEGLGKPPFDNHDTYVSFAKMKDTFGGGMDAGFATLAWKALGAKEYAPGDYIKWYRGANRGSGPMWDESRMFNLFKDIPELQVPVWFIAGEHDMNTPVALIKEYFEFVEAPEKYLIIMENCAHTPFIGNSARFNREIMSINPKS